MLKRRGCCWAVLCITCLLVVLVVIGRRFFVQPQSVIIINCPTEIVSTSSHAGNNRQRTSDVWLGCYNGQLYYFGGRKDSIIQTEFDNSLCVFQQAELVEIANLSKGNNNVIMLGIVDRFVYYLENCGGDYLNQKLYCYDLENSEESLLFCGPVRWAASMYFADDGSVFFPLKPVRDEITQFIHVDGQNVLGVGPLTEGYLLGDYLYFVMSDYQDAQVERISQATVDGNIILEEIPFEQAYDRSIIPYENGLLVHNEGLNTLLYRIDAEGSVTELFSIPCLGSKSAVNVHGEDAYISFVRYEKYGEKGMLRYEKDSLEGTYRISLIDGFIEKINDMCFTGIYNFDDTCFYCSDSQGNIYKMGFEGAIEPVLLVKND